MSRKNLSRTIIEGGRYRGNQFDRRLSHGEDRAHLREWLDRVRPDPDEADAFDPAPRRRVSKQFRDKLGPPRRWLAAQVGRPWDLVYAELRATFDRRTIAGAHVVDDHMLGWVYRGDLSEVRQYRGAFHFHVDRHGILRRGALFGRSWYRLVQQTRAWVGDRVAASTYRGWLWFSAEPVGAPCHRRWECGEPVHHVVRHLVYHRVRHVVAGTLTRGDRRRLDALPDEIRRQFVVTAAHVGL